MAEGAGKKAKRRVKDPETFRERALKASTADPQAPDGRRTRLIARPLAGAWRAVKRSLKVIFYRRPFLLFKRPLRLLGKVLLLSYLKGSWQELRQVTWPSWKQSRQLTIAVILFAGIFGGAVAGVDWGLDKIFKHILLK